MARPERSPIGRRSRYDHRPRLPPQKGQAASGDHNHAAGPFIDEAGYTLIEVVITMGLAAIMAGLAFSVYLFSAQATGSWQKNLDAENAVHLVMQRVSRDLFSATQISKGGSREWLLTQSSGQVIVYALQDQVLTRNGRRMHPQSVAVASFQLGILMRDGSLRPRMVEELREHSPASVVHFEVVLTLRDRQAARTVRTTVVPRLTRSWTLLPGEAAFVPGFVNFEARRYA